VSSLADEPQGLQAAVARRFADADARRMAELDRLIASGFGGTDPKRIPEEEMGREDTLRLQLEVARLAEERRRGAGLVPLRGNDRAIGRAEEELRAARPGAGPAARAPSAAGVTEELTMTRKPTPCPECGSPYKHKARCSKPARNGAAAAPTSAANGVAHVREAEASPASPFDAHGRAPDELLAVIAACRAELKRQRDEAAAIVAKVDEVLEGLTEVNHG
jgi:hypothetical protein